MTQIRVAGNRPGPVHVGAERPLTEGEDRNVTDSPLVRAHLAVGNLVELDPAPKPATRSRGKES
jgi:hypothetical protein